MITVCMRIAALALVLAFGCAGIASAQPAPDAAALRARHESLRASLANSPFRRPLVLESVQTPDELRGDVYAVVEQPFSVTGAALRGSADWCEVLILHLNVKHCSAAGQGPREVLSLVVGRKVEQALADAHRVDFAYSVPAAGPDYLRVQMTAADGPLYTHDYRLALEAMPLDAHTSFIHLSYAYAYGTAARMAMQAYLATAGRGKVGFSVIDKAADGKPVYIAGVRGVVERNAMRYFLAVEAYLGATSAPPAERSEKRLRDWHAATERSPQQLHELELDEYLVMKRHELQRQRAGAAAGLK